MPRTRELLVFLLLGVVLLSWAANSQVEAQRRGSSRSRDYVRKLFKWHSPAGRSNSAGTGRGLMKWMMKQNMFQTPAPQSNIIIIQPSQATTTATTSPTTSPTTTTTTSQTTARAAADAADGNKVKTIADDAAAEKEDVSSSSSISVNDKVAIVNEAAVKPGGGAEVLAAPAEHAATAAVNELNQRNGNYRNPTTRRHASQKSRQKPQSKRRNADVKKNKKKKKQQTKNRKNRNKNKKKNKRKQAKKKPQQIQLNGNTSNNNSNNNNIAIGDTSSSAGADVEGGPGSNRIVVPNSSFGAVINAFRQLQNYQHQQQQQQQPGPSSQSQPQSTAHGSWPLFNVFNS